MPRRKHPDGSHCYCAGPDLPVSPEHDDPGFYSSVDKSGNATIEFVGVVPKCMMKSTIERIEKEGLIRIAVTFRSIEGFEILGQRNAVDELRGWLAAVEEGYQEYFAPSFASREDVEKAYGSEDAT